MAGSSVEFSVKVMTMKQYYVYSHNRKDTNMPFYIGKGSGNRCYSLRARNDYWHRIADKHGFEVSIIATNLDEELSFFVEEECIDVYKRSNIQLTNMTDGGEGASGYRHTDEHKESLKGNEYWKLMKENGFKGKTHSDEQKAKWSEMRKGVTSPRKGVHLSDETKQKISMARIGKALSNEHCKAISKGLMGNKHTAKLTDDEVRFIRANRSKMTHVELGEKFGVHKNTIHKIWRNERYKDVK